MCRAPPPGAARHDAERAVRPPRGEPLAPARRSWPSSRRGGSRSPIDDRLFKKFFAGVQGFLAEGWPATPTTSCATSFNIRVAPSWPCGCAPDPALGSPGASSWRPELPRAPGGAGGGLDVAVAQHQGVDPRCRSERSRLRPPPPGSTPRSTGAGALGWREDPVLQAKVNGVDPRRSSATWPRSTATSIADLSHRHDRRPLGTAPRGQPAHRAAGSAGDLQFIRINGTVVGGLAGLAIYSIGQHLGRHGGPTASSGRPRRPRSG